MRIRLIDVRDHSIRELDLTSESRDMPGWQDGVAGWSIGPKGSGASIALDEPLGDCHVGVFSVSFQLLLWGTAKELPDVWLLPQGRSTGKLVPFEEERWLRADRADLGRVAMGGDVRLRLDQSPIRFGNYILECLPAADTTKERCAFCNEILPGSYFRVGSQQACAACTRKFQQEMRVNHARHYRRAVSYGVPAAIGGGVIHGILLTTTQLSSASILIGLLVGIAMRIASKESAGFYHRLTAVLLTAAAGGLPWRWGGRLGDGTYGPMIFLVAGMLVAWMVTARNVRTEIHGPFRSRPL